MIDLPIAPADSPKRKAELDQTVDFAVQFVVKEAHPLGWTRVDAFKNLVGPVRTDVLRALRPEKQIYTFWAYFRNASARDAGLRIDHTLLSSQMVGRLPKADVDKHVHGREHMSGHTPMWINLAGEPINRVRARK